MSRSTYPKASEYSTASLGASEYSAMPEANEYSQHTKALASIQQYAKSKTKKRIKSKTKKSQREKRGLKP